MKKLFVFLLLGMFLVSFVSAEMGLPPVKQGETITLRQTCGSCTYVNVSVYDSNSNRVISNKGMVDIGGGYWEYDFSNTSITGRYDYPTCGDIDGTHTCSDSESLPFFLVTKTGEEFNSAKSTSYIAILIISIFLGLGLFFAGLKLPSKNKSDEMSGYIIAVSNLKYLKHFLISCSYLTFVWVTYLTWMISYAFLDFNFLSSIFKFIFYTLAFTTLPLFILYIYITIVNFIRDSQVADLLLRGLTVR